MEFLVSGSSDEDSAYDSCSDEEVLIDVVRVATPMGDGSADEISVAGSLTFLATGNSSLGVNIPRRTPRSTSPAPSDAQLPATPMSTQRQRQLQMTALAPPSPSRAMPRTNVSGLERKQQQRRMLESVPRTRLLDAFHLDRTAHNTRIPAHAARGKLLLHLEVARGFALNAGTAHTKSSSRIVRHLPPLLGERAQRVAIVQRTGSPERAPTVRYPRCVHQPEFLASMGYHDRAAELRHKPKEDLSDNRRDTPHQIPGRDVASVGKSTMISTDDPLPPPSGGGIELAPRRDMSPSFPSEPDEHHMLSQSSRLLSAPICNTVATVCPHLVDTSRVPPALELGGVVPPHNSLCTPPPHLRHGDREFRLIEFAEEIDDLVNLPVVLRRSRQGAARPPTPVKERSSKAEKDNEEPPVPEGVDDRPWGRAVRDPQAEVAERLRLRMESQQPIPSHTPTCFGAVEFFIEALCGGLDDDNGVSPSDSRRGSGGDALESTMMSFSRRRSTMHIPRLNPADNPRDDLLLVLSIGVNGVHEGATSLPYCDAEANALWFHRIMQRIGARATLLRGYEGTLGAIRETLGRIVAEARVASKMGRNAKVIVYVSGKGRVTAEGDVLFAPQDGCGNLNEDIQLASSQCVNLHELASKSIGLAMPAGDADESMNGRRDENRWSFPVVMYDIVVDRCRKNDRPYVPPTTPAEKMDFWRPWYYGGVLALKHEGGTLSAACSARHHGLIVYYVCKAAEGKLSAQQHVNSITHITQFIAQKLRSRTIPTMELRCSGVADDFAPRTAEEVFHPMKALFTTAAAKREAKRVREKKPCRWTLTCEVSIEYRYNPNVFVTQLTKRIKELIHAKSRPRQPNAPPLTLWVGMRRMEHRFYLPIPLDPAAPQGESTDVFRYDLISAITRSDIAASGGSGQHYVDASLESIDNAQLEYMKGDHCVVIHSQGTGHNRWTHNPFVTATDGNDTMGGIRSHSDADLDFIFVLSQCAVRQQEMSVLSFLDGKHGCELVTVHGSGSINDLRKLIKFVRFGSLDIQHCRNCRVLKVDVTGIGEEEEAETASIVLVQKVIRRYLTRRVMTSRLAAAMTFYRQQRQSWVDCFETFGEDLLRWFIDFKEGAFVAVEAAQGRQRRELRASEAAAYKSIFAQMLYEWELLQNVCRKLIRDEELMDWWMFKRAGAAWPLYVHALRDCRHCSQVEHAVRDETLARHHVFSLEFEERFQLRQVAKRDYDAVVEATRPPRLGKIVKRQRTRFELPLEHLVRH